MTYENDMTVRRAHSVHASCTKIAVQESKFRILTEMKFALFVALAACGVLAVTAEFGRLFKRIPCDTRDVPAECQAIFYDYNSFDEAVAALGSDNYFSEYCGATCGRPLYDFLRRCDEATGSRKSTDFDFSCSSNAAGDPCESVLNDNNFIYACANETFIDAQCSDECREILTEATENIACCAFSYFAVAKNYLEPSFSLAYVPMLHRLCASVE